MKNYDLEYKGVKCTQVEWEDYIFYFEYLGKEYVFEQEIEVLASADTDHIRIVIEEQFLPFIKKMLIVEQTRKETAKDILQRWWREATKGRNENDETDGSELWYIKKVAEEYGVEVTNND